jgi:hypothetical protein
MHDLGVLVDPLDLDGVRVEATWGSDASGAPALHLRADGQVFERAVQKLAVEAVVKVNDMAHRQGADGTMTLWLPSRSESDEHARAVREEERTLNEAMASAGRTTADGRPIRVRFAFGESRADGTGRRRAPAVQ